MNSKCEYYDCIMHMCLVNGTMHTYWEEYFFVFLIAKQLQTNFWEIKCCLLLNLSKDFETNEKYDMS